MFMIDKIEMAGKSVMEPVELLLEEVIEPAIEPTTSQKQIWQDGISDGASDRDEMMELWWTCNRANYRAVRAVDDGIGDTNDGTDDGDL